MVTFGTCGIELMGIHNTHIHPAIKMYTYRNDNNKAMHDIITHICLIKIPDHPRSLHSHIHQNNIPFNGNLNLPQNYANMLTAL